MSKKINFSKLPIGTKVWSFLDGDGYISNIKSSNEYPLTVTFEDEYKSTYYIDGRQDRNDINPILFLQSFDIPNKAYKMPLPDLKIDAKIMVKHYESSEWVPAHFKQWHNRMAECFNGMRTSWTSPELFTCIWKFWRIPTKKELGGNFKNV